MSFCGNCYLCDCGGYDVEGVESYLLDDQVPVGLPVHELIIKLDIK